MALFEPKFAFIPFPFKGVGFEKRVSLAETMVELEGIVLKSNLMIPLALKKPPPLVHATAADSGEAGSE